VGEAAFGRIGEGVRQARVKSDPTQAKKVWRACSEVGHAIPFPVDLAWVWRKKAG